jgi:lipid-binding SYLF domain-containing protein
MRNIFVLFYTIAAFFVLFSPINSRAATEETVKLETATRVLGEVLNVPEDTIPKALMDNAQAVAVIPDVIKAGLVLGGRHGEGAMTVRTEDGTWSSPAFISLTGLSAGWQAGVKSSDIILVSTDRDAIDALEQGKLTLGAQVSVAAGPVGRSAEIGTDAKLDTAIYSYSRSEGIFAGISLSGALIELDREANVAFYGSPNITARQILSGQREDAPTAASRFSCLIAKYTGTTQRC